MAYKELLQELNERRTEVRSMLDSMSIEDADKRYKELTEIGADSPELKEKLENLGLAFKMAHDTTRAAKKYAKWSVLSIFASIWGISVWPSLFILVPLAIITTWMYRDFLSELENENIPALLDAYDKLVSHSKS